MERKGQAAMEFLMTYGWAILAAIIAIGVLAYFGVFSPGKLVADSVTLNAPLYASAGQADSTLNQVKVEIRNGAGSTIYLVEPSSTVTTTSGTTCTLNAATANEDIITMATDEQSIQLFDCPAGDLIAGDKFNGDIVVTYCKTVNATGTPDVCLSLAQISTGTIRATVI